MSTNKKLRDLGSFDDIIAKRAETLGGDGTTFPMQGFGTEWHLRAPDMQSAEWNDAFTDLHHDLSDDYITTADYREELLNMILGEEQAAKFVKECEKVNGGNGIDPAMLINRALTAYQEDRDTNPSRAKSRTTRPRPKRR